MNPTRTPARFRASAGAASAALLLALTACGGAAEPEEAPEGGASGGFPVTVEHFRGSTEIPEEPLRIAALDPSYVDATMLLGAELVAYTEYRKGDNPFPEYLGDVSELTDEAVNVGTIAEPDLEKILEAEPDLIISADVRQGEMYDQLTKIAPTVFSESTGPSWKENVVLLGEAIGKKEEAEEKVAAYEARAAAVGEAILEQDPETTYSLVRFAGEDTMRLYTTNSFIGDIMADMGIPRPEGQPDTMDSILVPLSQEQILEADATFIMESTWNPGGSEGDASVEQQETFESNPLWGELTGEIVEVDDSIFLSSVSIQGAEAAITELAEHFGVDPQLES
ncbi:ABC transporter substrate-binding protein [Zhihengliuella salsuginis]|uniref:Iron siderophore-binding protein n=1 Tax=Zhihengliuella salsuginis TaxID=578222 RepID=A0ABQ3GCC1_9MICC|nr:iron-siderophore ABC transporter substrate-binding protein [Zhihengliuella salsuginis]GHD00282.1 iron siderophore-binding protein [Zhihengliuella salsuginis]